MGKIAILYDNTMKVGERIKTIIGNKSFGDIIIKRKQLFSVVEEITKKIKAEIDIYKIDNQEQFSIVSTYPKETTFFHLFANEAINNVNEFEIILEKLKFINETIQIECQNKTVGIVFHDKDYYIEFLKDYIASHQNHYSCENKLQTESFTDLTDYNNLIMYITKGFDARYFNSIQSDNYTVTKKSKDKKKMKMEYTYYWLLPENMKSWMVMPFDYREEAETASYKMERMPMTDVAIRWTHEAIDVSEFKLLMDKVFYFLKSRNKKNVSTEEYVRDSEKLYVEKVDSRIAELKKLKEFEQLEKLIASGTEYSTIDDIIKYYKQLYTIVTKKYEKDLKHELVIGHGDVFFANMLYSKEVNLLRLIDPKGALKESDLWMNPYYDIAKLSHSVCGNYDFFNIGAYTIELNKNMKFNVNICFDNTEYKEIFKNYLEESGYNYILTRLYEASLFLSMLPLHIDNPHKVFGFILNAINILKEVEKNV